MRLIKKELKVTDLPREFINKGFKSLSSVYDKAEDIQSLCTDEYIPFGDLAVSNRENTLLLYTHVYEADKGERLTFTRHSLSQLANRYGLPMRYLDKCMKSSYPRLVSENLNTWLHGERGGDKTCLLRKNGSSVRGILSDQYAIYDSPRILSVLEDLGIEERMGVRGALVTPEKLHLRLVDTQPIVTKESAGEKDLFMGLIIDSSDVGRSSLSMSYIVYKQVCSNGMVVPMSICSNLFQRHIGKGLSDESFGDRVAAFLKGLGEVREAFKQNYVGAKLTNTEKFLKNEERVENLRKNILNVSQDTVNKVIELHNTGKYGGDNVWSLINSVTEVAQDFTLDTRLDLERRAGLLLVA